MGASPFAMHSRCNYGVFSCAFTVQRVDQQNKRCGARLQWEKVQCRTIDWQMCFEN